MKAFDYAGASTRNRTWNLLITNHIHSGELAAFSTRRSTAILEWHWMECDRTKRRADWNHQRALGNVISYRNNGVSNRLAVIGEIGDDGGLHEHVEMFILAMSSLIVGHCK